MAGSNNTPRPISLRRHLLVGILVPIALFVVVDTYSLYRQALGAVNIAYDRTLLASAKAIGELLEVDGVGDQATLRAQLKSLQEQLVVERRRAVARFDAGGLHVLPPRLHALG